MNITKEQFQMLPSEYQVYFEEVGVSTLKNTHPT